MANDTYSSVDGRISSRVDVVQHQMFAKSAARLAECRLRLSVRQSCRVAAIDVICRTPTLGGGWPDTANTSRSPRIESHASCKLSGEISPPASGYMWLPLIDAVVERGVVGRKGVSSALWACVDADFQHLPFESESPRQRIAPFGAKLGSGILSKQFGSRSNRKMPPFARLPSRPDKALIVFRP